MKNLVITLSLAVLVPIFIVSVRYFYLYVYPRIKKFSRYQRYNFVEINKNSVDIYVLAGIVIMYVIATLYTLFGG